MSLKQRLQSLGGRQWLMLWAASIVVSVIGNHLARNWGSFAINPPAQFALDALGVTLRALPAVVVGMAAGVGALPGLRGRQP